MTDSTDIAERLRAMVETGADPEAIYEAADTIETLRGQVAAQAQLLTAAMTARAALSELLMTRDPKVYSDALRALDEAIGDA